MVLFLILPALNLRAVLGAVLPKVPGKASARGHPKTGLDNFRSILSLQMNFCLSCGVWLKLIGQTWPRGYKTFFMLNSAEHEIFPAYKC